MSPVYRVVNGSIQLSERASQIAYWQKDFIKSGDFGKIIASIDKVKKNFKGNELVDVIKDVQEQMDFSDFGLVAIEEIHNSGVTIGKNRGAEIDLTFLKDQDHFNQRDYSKLPSHFLKMPLLDVHSIGVNTGVAGYEDLKADQKEEVKSILVKTFELLSRGEIKIQETWRDWCACLKEKHPISARLIARIASITFDEIVTQLLIGGVIIGVSIGSIGIKQEPVASAPIVTNVYVTNIHVVQEERINYYYQVIYSDDEDKEQVGYVSKRQYNQALRSLSDPAVD